MKDWLCFIQPANKRGDPEYVFLSKKAAIQHRKEVDLERGVPILSDEDLLLDFNTVHYAWEVDKPEGI